MIGGRSSAPRLRGATLNTDNDTDTSSPTVRTRGDRRLLLLFGAVALVSLGIDALTKILAVTNLTPGEPVRLFGGVVYLSLTRNSGAAFSFAKDFTPVLTTLAIVVCIGIVWYAYRKLGSWQWAVALGLIAGGACGNLMDRLFRPPGFMVGHVVDFVSVFHPHGGYFAIFNMADSSLVLGVIWVILLELTGRRADGTRIGKTTQDDSGAA